MNKQQWLELLGKSPGDFELREIYADWLEEEGETKKAMAWREITKNKWEPDDFTDWTNRTGTNYPENDKWVWLRLDVFNTCGYAHKKHELNMRNNSWLPTHIFDIMSCQLDTVRPTLLGLRFDTYQEAELALVKALIELQQKQIRI